MGVLVRVGGMGVSVGVDVGGRAVFVAVGVIGVLVAVRVGSVVEVNVNVGARVLVGVIGSALVQAVNKKREIIAQLKIILFISSSTPFQRYRTRLYVEQSIPCVSSVQTNKRDYTLFPVKKTYKSSGFNDAQGLESGQHGNQQDKNDLSLKSLM